MASDTKVVNIRVANIRPEYQNLKEWIKEPNNVYIGRAGIVFVDGERYPKQSSIWANPYKIGRDGDRNTVLTKYEVYIKNRLEREPFLMDELDRLRGKTFGCWCAPEPCHGNILVKILNDCPLSRS